MCKSSIKKNKNKTKNQKPDSGSLSSSLDINNMKGHSQSATVAAAQGSPKAQEQWG